MMVVRYKHRHIVSINSQWLVEVGKKFYHFISFLWPHKHVLVFVCNLLANRLLLTLALGFVSLFMDLVSSTLK